MNRIYHTWDKWECYPAGFFEDIIPNNLDRQTAEIQYAEFFKDLTAFERGLKTVINNWKNSCEHNLTNENLNRIAWLGQAAACAELGLPSCLRAGFSLLTVDQQLTANNLALKYLNLWLTERGYPETDGIRKHKTADIY